jgi:hypothetical protein
MFALIYRDIRHGIFYLFFRNSCRGKHTECDPPSRNKEESETSRHHFVSRGKLKKEINRATEIREQEIFLIFIHLLQRGQNMK